MSVIEATSEVEPNDVTADDPASAAFPTRKERSASSDEDYGSKVHKKKFHARNGGSGRATPDISHDSDAAWRRGAAKKVVTYDEAQVDYGLESEGDDDAYAKAEGGLPGYDGEVEEIDQVLSHSRDEDRLQDPTDLPQENLVSPLPIKPTLASSANTCSAST